MKYLVFILAVLNANLAFAGGEVGNSGHVILCTDSAGNVRSAELLDYYELRLNGGQLKFDQNLATYKEKLLDLFHKWSETAPKRMAQYTRWLEEFESEAGIHSGIEIPHIPDTGSIAIPRNCKAVSIAFQRPDADIFPGMKRYMINKDIWDLMDETQKAGLVLHELIYRESIRAAHQTSLATRYFNGYLASGDPDPFEYASIVSQMPLHWVEYGKGLVLSLGYVNDCTGSFCSPGFHRITEISKDGTSVTGTVSEVLGDFKLGDWTMTFINSEDTGGNGFEFNLKLGYLRSSLRPKTVEFLDRFILTITKWGRESLNINLAGDGQWYGWFGEYMMVKTDPNHSWLMNANGEVIHHIKNIANGLIETNQNQFWVWNKNTKRYEIKRESVQLGKDMMSCEAADYFSYRCELPAVIECKAKGQLVTLKLKNRGLIKVGEYRDLPSTYLIELYKGQIVDYKATGWRGSEPVKLSEDSWVAIKWSKDGTCWLYGK